MALLRRKVVIGAKIEGTYGDAEAVSVNDTILVFNPSLTLNIDTLERAPATDTLGNLAPQMGARTATITFSTDLYGSGTRGTAPSIDVLLRACGLEPTTEATHSVLYEARDSGFESATIVVWQDGLKHVLTGCRGRCSFNFNMGQRGSVDFTFEAKEFTYTDEAIPLGNYSTIIPPVCLNQYFSVGGYAAIIPALKIDLVNTLSRAPSVNEISGYARVDITDRKVEGTFSPEATILATHDWYTTWSGGVKSDLTITLGNTAGNVIRLTAPNVIYTGLGFEDRSGILAQSMSFRCAQVINVTSGVCDADTTATVLVDTSVFDTADEFNGSRVTISGEGRIINDTSADGDLTLESAFDPVPSVGAIFAISKREFQLLFR